MSGLGRITASQLFNTQNLQGLSASQRQIVDEGLEKVQDSGDNYVIQYLKSAADKIEKNPKQYGVKFAALPEKGNTMAFGQTVTLQTGEDDPIKGAQITLNPKRMFEGDRATQVRNFVGTLWNEFASKFAGSSSYQHELVSDLVEAHATSALQQAENGTKGDVSGQAIAAQAKKQRGGSLDNMQKLDVYNEKPRDTGDTSVMKLKAQGMVNDEQAAAMLQAAGIAAPRPIDSARFKSPESGSMLSLQA